MDDSSLKAPIQMNSALFLLWKKLWRFNQEEKRPTKIQEEAKEEHEILLDFEEKEVKSKSNLEVILPFVPQSHSYPLHFPNLRIEVNITKEAPFSFSMSKLRNEVIYDVFPIDAWYLFLGRSLKFCSNIVFLWDV